MKVYLAQLGNLRDPEAHRRELLPHQKHLALGIAGEIRTRLIRYRSKFETSEDYFPRIESARDSLGHIWTPSPASLDVLITKQILRPDDLIDYVITASDPLGQALQFRMVVEHDRRAEWQTANTFSLKILEQHITKQFSVRLEIKSSRPHHASNTFDDKIEFFYTVLPRK